MDTPKSEQKPNPNDAFGPPTDDTELDAPPPEKAKAKPTPTPDKLAISPALRRAAKSLGISEDDIENTHPDQLQEAVSFLIEDRERLRPVQPTPTKEPDEDEDDDDSMLEKMDKELQLDPRLKRLLKKSTASAKEIKELKSALTEQTKREQDRLARAGNDAIDDGFDSLGEDFKAIFGDGTRSTLKKDSDEYQRRVAVYHASGIDFANDSPATIRRKITKSAKTIFGNFVKKAAPPPEPEEEEEATYTPQVKKFKSGKDGPDIRGGHVDMEWEEAGTARPTNRKVTEKKGPKAAANAVRQFYAEKGTPGSSDEDVLNGVPD